MKPNTGKAILGGFVGTGLMTLMMYYAAPMMMGQKMDIAAMLGSMMGNSWALGMRAHFVNGTLIFPLIYAFVLYRFLLGAPWLKGIPRGTYRKPGLHYIAPFANRSWVHLVPR